MVSGWQKLSKIKIIVIGQKPLARKESTVGEQEGYKPSDEEIQAAEATMTDEQKAMTPERLTEAKKYLESLNRYKEIIIKDIEADKEIMEAAKLMPEFHTDFVESAIDYHQTLLQEVSENIMKIEGEIQ